MQLDQRMKNVRKIVHLRTIRGDHAAGSKSHAQFPNIVNAALSIWPFVSPLPFHGGNQSYMKVSDQHDTVAGRPKALGRPVSQGQKRELFQNRQLITTASIRPLAQWVLLQFLDHLMGPKLSAH
jgi:hypothetical protein